MEEQLINFETAKLAKEKGFKQSPTQLSEPYYNHKGELNGDVTKYIKAYLKDKKRGTNTREEFESIKAPTQSLLQKWLREKHSIFVFADSIMDHTLVKTGIKRFLFNIDDIDTLDADTIELFDNYEQALERGLQEALKLIK